MKDSWGRIPLSCVLSQYCMAQLNYYEKGTGLELCVTSQDMLFHLAQVPAFFAFTAPAQV